MTATDLQTNLGRVIRRQRETQGFSQEGFADHVGLHRTYFGQVERGNLNLTLLSLLRIAEGLSVRPSSLLAEAEEFDPAAAAPGFSRAPKPGRPPGSGRKPKKK